MLHPKAPGPLPALAAPVAAEPPTVLVCRGHETEWNLRIADLEPAERGFRIVRARIAHGAQGFTHLSSEPILVTAPGDPGARPRSTMSRC